MGYIRNAVRIDVPVDDVFRLTNDVRTWPALFSEYQSSEVIDEEPGRVTFRLTTHPDEQGQQWSWVALRETNFDRRSTYSQRMPSSGPFEKMEIRWWYDSLGPASAVMTWEQEFTMSPQAHVTEEQATAYLNKQTRIQQQVIKERVEQICGGEQQQHHRGVIIAQYTPGQEEQIVDAWTRSDATELPQLLGVTSRHVWVLGNIYVHFVETQYPLHTILKDYLEQPLFKATKAELDAYVRPLTSGPAVGREIYRWTKGHAQGPEVEQAQEASRVKETV